MNNTIEKLQKINEFTGKENSATFNIYKEMGLDINKQHNSQELKDRLSDNVYPGSNLALRDDRAVSLSQENSLSDILKRSLTTDLVNMTDKITSKVSEQFFSHNNNKKYSYDEKQKVYDYYFQMDINKKADLYIASHEQNKNLKKPTPWERLENVIEKNTSSKNKTPVEKDLFEYEKMRMGNADINEINQEIKKQQDIRKGSTYQYK